MEKTPCTVEHADLGTDQVGTLQNKWIVFPSIFPFLKMLSLQYLLEDENLDKCEFLNVGVSYVYNYL